MASQSLRLAVAQAHTLPTTADTISALESIAKVAASQGADLSLFPEAYIGGYPRTATFGSAIGARHPEGKEQFLRYFKDAVDLGDIPEGGGDRWVRRQLEQPRDGVRGDGTREELERIAKETGVFLVIGLIERCAGTLYCGVVYVCPRYGIIGKRRKVMPVCLESCRTCIEMGADTLQTGSERLIWGQGQPSSLRAVTTVIKGVKLTLASAICWENYMPLLRQSLYSQNVNLYLAPTADGRDTWLPLMRTIACEGRCVVLSSNQCMAESKIPDWITGKTTEVTKSGNDRSTVGTVGHSQIEASKTVKAPATITSDDTQVSPRSSTDQPRGVIPDKSDRRSSAGTKLPLKSRRKSTVTDDGHQIILPGVIEDGEAVEEEATSPLALLSKSHGTIDQLEEPTAPIFPVKRRQSTITKDGHEIVFPDVKISDTPNGNAPTTQHDPPKLISRGGSCIVSSTGEVLAGPLWDEENGLLVVDVDFDDCLRGRLDLDVGGSYSR